MNPFVHRDAATAPTDDLPAAWYCEGEAFQHEKRTIFATSWQLLCSTTALREPGDYVTANLGGWPVFAIVDDAHRIGAFRNVCRHQGMQVLEKPRGTCEQLRCRYHGWTYDRKGHMVSAPPLVAPADAHSPDNHLRGIRAHVLGPLLYVNLDAQAAPFDVALAAAAPAVAELVSGRVVDAELTTDYACNWKTYVEHCLSTRRFDAPGESDAWLWQWPLVMFVRRASALHVQQIVPRTFSRTRVIEYVCAPDGADANDALDFARTRAQADQSACEALQRHRAAGEGDRAHALAGFHRAVREIHAQRPRIDPLPLQQGTA
jgi:nitrite reductase/ring-hydroxylating ferredoxin subunit